MRIFFFQDYLYECFFLDIISAMASTCAVYFVDRCIICKSHYTLFDKHECLQACDSSLITSTLNN